MAFKTLDQFPQSEKADFETSCAKRKLNAADFVVALEEQYPAAGIGHIHRIVHVRRENFADEKADPAGSGSAWNVAFEVDLLAGVYD